MIAGLHKLRNFSRDSTNLTFAMSKWLGLDQKKVKKLFVLHFATVCSICHVADDYIYTFKLKPPSTLQIHTDINNPTREHSSTTHVDYLTILGCTQRLNIPVYGLGNEVECDF